MKKIAIIIALIIFAHNAQADTLSIAKDLISSGIMENSESGADITKLELSFAKGKTDLQTSTSEDISLTSLEVDDRAKRFSAFISIDGALPVEVAGSYKRFIEVPALTHKMSASETITASDLAYIDLEANKAEHGFILDEAELIGKSPTRTIMANRPILDSQVKKPNWVENKKAVTIYFKNNLIEMQDMGIAMDNGVEGDVVRVKNNASNIVVSGKVVGERLVEVTPQSAILASRN